VLAIHHDVHVEAGRHDTGAESLHGVWGDFTTLSHAVSNAMLVGAGFEVIGVTAAPRADLSASTLSLVRWSERGAEPVATREVGGVFPGAPMALVRHGGDAGVGFTLYWSHALVDGGTQARAIDLDVRGFTGEERNVAATELSRGQWARDAWPQRRRTSAQDLAPPTPVGRTVAKVEVRRSRPTPTVVLGTVPVTSGWDLAGFESSVGALRVDAHRAWVAVSRGRCHETRIEVFRLDDNEPTLRARWIIGAEVGVRWIRIDARRDVAVVTWHQSLIPVRIECSRGPAGATLRDHGVRVAVATAEGAPPAPMPPPRVPDAGADDAATEDVTIDDNVNEALPTSQRSL
jgi:hypothetical protein